MVAIQFTNRFFGFQPKVRECGQFLQNLRPELLGVFAAGVEVPCKLVEVASHLAAWGRQGGKRRQCFRPFRATLKFLEIEPQSTLKILQSKTCEKAKPLLIVTVHTERSSCPCFAAALSGSPTKSVRSWRSISFRRLMKDSRCSFPKRKIPPTQRSDDFVG